MNAIWDTIVSGSILALVVAPLAMTHADENPSVAAAPAAHLPHVDASASFYMPGVIRQHAAECTSMSF